MGMYCDDMIKIGKAANGYILEVCVPLKDTGKAKDTMSLGGRSLEEQFVCKDEAEVAAKVTELLPKLDAEYTSEKAFAAAFGEAVTEEEED